MFRIDILNLAFSIFLVACVPSSNESETDQTINIRTERSNLTAQTDLMQIARACALFIDRRASITSLAEQGFSERQHSDGTTMTKRDGRLFPGGLLEINVQAFQIGSRREFCRADYYNGLSQDDTQFVLAAFSAELNRLGWQNAGFGSFTNAGREVRLTSSRHFSAHSGRTSVLVSHVHRR